MRGASPAKRVPMQQGSWRYCTGHVCMAEGRDLLVAMFETPAAMLEAGPYGDRRRLEKIDMCGAVQAAQRAAQNAFSGAAQ